MSEFHGKIALVTGGHSGIGRAAADLLAQRGASVTIAGIRPDLASDPDLPGVTYEGLDVSDPDAVTRLVDEIAADRGLDVLVTAAASNAMEAPPIPAHRNGMPY